MALVDYASSSNSDTTADAHTNANINASANSPPSAAPFRKRKRGSPSPPARTPAVEASSADPIAASNNAPNALPPLPPSFHDLYASAARTSTHDDPSLHGGRKRAVRHVDGNWPSHVFLEWLPSASDHAKLEALVSRVSAARSQPRGPSSGRGRLAGAGAPLTSLLTSALSTPLPLHVSLSAPLAVATPRKDGFLAALRESLPSLAGFGVRLGGVDWVGNGEGTRCFLVLRCMRPEGDELGRLLRWCNGVCAEAGYEGLYEVGEGADARTTEDERGRDNDCDRFHFSVAWCLGDIKGDGNGDGDGDRADSGWWREQEGVEKALKDVRGIEVHFSAVKVKIGNSVTALSFDGRQQAAGRTILE